MKKYYPITVSECCGVEPKSNGDSDTEDIGLCPSCGGHCNYIQVDEYGDEVDPKKEKEEFDLPASWEPDLSGNGALSRK